MRRFAIIAVSALALAACSEQMDPTGSIGRQHLINDIPGNENPCGVVYNGGCFGPLDGALKALYEMNNTYAKLGEVEYNTASNNNNSLANIFQNSVTSAYALGQLDNYINGLVTKPSGGGYSTCAAQSLLTYANWIREKIVAKSVDMTGQPTLVQCISPLVNLTASFSANSGVTLSGEDPYHYAFGTPYGNSTAVETSFNWYRIDNGVPVLLGSSPWVAENPPTGKSPTRTWTDPTALGDPLMAVTYTYAVEQCDKFWSTCGELATVTITVPIQTPAGGGGGGGGGGDQCLNHDNSTHDPATNNNSDKTKCDKLPPGQVKKT